MSEQNMDLVRRHFEEIWNQRDPSACDELMAADYLENGAAPFETRAPGRVSGPAAMRGTVQWLISQSRTSPTTSRPSLPMAIS